MPDDKAFDRVMGEYARYRAASINCARWKQECCWRMSPSWLHAVGQSPGLSVRQMLAEDPAGNWLLIGILVVTSAHEEEPRLSQVRDPQARRRLHVVLLPLEDLSVEQRPPVQLPACWWLTVTFAILPARRGRLAYAESVNTAESDLENQVRQLAGIGLSTRRIAGVIGDVSQSTVVRVLRKINTGPQPILLEKGTSHRVQVTAETVRLAALVLLSLSLAVIAAAVATMAWM